MNTGDSFGRKLVKYILLLISHYSFFIASLLTFSYFQDILRAFVWQKSFGLILSVLIIGVVLWLVTAIGYLMMK